MGTVKAFGGADLCGSKAVRFAHLDEAGTSRKERYAVVGGFVSHADNQWRALNQYLIDMADDLVPAEYRAGIIFHAKDLWHGAKKFHRDRWPREKRMAILEAIALIPSKFNIPVVVGITQKDKHRWSHASDENDVDASNYALAFGLAAGCVEYFMRTFTQDEVATLIAEDVPHMRAHAKRGYRVLQDPSWPWDDYPQLIGTAPLTRIVEHPMFAAKDESSILQVADLIAFTMCRRANGSKDVNHLIEHYARYLIELPNWLDESLREDGISLPEKAHSV
jgi:hypothetical protein